MSLKDSTIGIPPKMTGLMEKTTKLLQQQLLTENHPYTYKLLSRELNIHVNDAKRLLYSFYLKNKELITASFVIVGSIKDSPGCSIKLTENLEDQIQFEEVRSISVYSLAPKNCKINEVVKLVKDKLHDIETTEEKMKTWGLIQGPGLKKSAASSVLTRPSGGSQSSTAPSLKKEQPKVVKSESSTKPSTSSSSEIKKEAKKNTNEAPDMRSMAEKMLARNRASTDTQDTSKQSTFGRSTTEKASILTSKPLANSRRSKTEPNAPAKPLDTIKISEEEDEEEIKCAAATVKPVGVKTPAVVSPKKKTAKEIELESMFDSDEDDVIEHVQEGNKHAKAVEEEHSELTKEELNELEELGDLEDLNDSEVEGKNEKEQEDEDDKIQEIEKENISKDDSVKQYYDEDGFLVTEKKAPAVPKPKPDPKANPTRVLSKKKIEAKPEAKKRANDSATGPAAKKSKTASTGKQSSLLSFFGKKTR
ncbi:hypothetical protein WICPIJ_002300 [Wickerhamomyces pijperi]|uniref:DNA polymerase delta subunit 3 n=1 Tax=Wickerhamomyces pijperi TaxID=599730 RepID=A0A9P8TPY4_WICPI|nr:hypothetical protein WICPIJ_002300 [Wickerhamomyces pijperi]